MKTLSRIAFLHILLSACSPNQSEPPATSRQVPVSAEKPETAEVKGPLNYYFMDPFASAPFEMGKPTLKLVRSLDGVGADEVKQPISDLRASVEADSMVTISIGEGKMVYYTGSGQSWLYYGRFVDNSLPFVNGIRIGMEKSAFAARFDKLKDEKDLPAVIQIANPNNREVYNFIFYHDTLGMVVYDSFIE